MYHCYLGYSQMPRLNIQCTCMYVCAVCIIYVCKVELVIVHTYTNTRGGSYHSYLTTNFSFDCFGNTI